MDADQFRQLLAATKRKARRPDNYSSGDPLEWITWRRNTTRIITLNGWDNADDLEKAKMMERLRKGRSSEGRRPTLEKMMTRILVMLMVIMIIFMMMMSRWKGEEP